MNGSSAANAELVLDGHRCRAMPAGDGGGGGGLPAGPYLAKVGAAIGRLAVALGAQNVCEHEAARYTGEVAPAMLKRRRLRLRDRRPLGAARAVRRDETPRWWRSSARQQAAGLTPILCVGETLEERERARPKRSSASSSMRCSTRPVSMALAESAVIAYEPVWAIGTGKTATPEQAQDVHAFIRARLAASATMGDRGRRLQILYGGSMKGANAAGTVRPWRYRRRPDRRRLAEGGRFSRHCRRRQCRRKELTLRMDRCKIAYCSSCTR